MYKEEVTRAMGLLAKDSRTVFIGQNVIYTGGGDLLDTLEDVPAEKRLEVPVIEDTQLGMCIGLSLAGYIPICIFPRMDFLICAMNQLVNHLDKIAEMSHGRYSPKVIIRTIIGATKPLNPGAQHHQDYTSSLYSLLKTVRIKKLVFVEDIVPTYLEALKSDKSWIIVEVGECLRNG